MRNLNECQAEVFRRSEKRIKKRKQHRKHILLACIPLVLCITLFSGFFLRGPKRAASDVLDEIHLPMCEPNGYWDGYSAVSVSRIEVSGLDFSKTYTDTADVMRIADQLYSCSQSKSESYEEPTESVMDEDCKESPDTEDQHSMIADSATGGTITEEVRGENENGSSGQDGFYGVTADSATVGYRITLTTDAGTQIEYRLSDNVLENRTTKQICKLTQAEALTLKELLGIPDP